MAEILESGEVAATPARPSPHVLDQIRSALNGLRYGTVTVIVQDGVVVQVDRTERLRFSRGAADSR